MIFKKKVLIDCDPGHDDAIMLLISCFTKRFKIVGVTTSSGNQTVDKTTRNASNLLHYFNREDIPIAKGHRKPMARQVMTCGQIHGASGLDGFVFPKYDHHLSNLEACDFIICKLNEHKRVTVITTGPMTNLGLAIKKDPAIAKRIKEIVLMGGSTGEGNITKAAEFNILVDPEAADICFKSGVKIRMLGLNVTRQVLVTDEVLEDAAKINTKGSDLFVQLMEVFNRNQREFFNLPAGPLHDPATVVSLLKRNVFKFTNMNVQIDASNGETKGKTLCVKAKPYNCKVATSINIKRYWDVIYKYLSKVK